MTTQTLLTTGTTFVSSLLATNNLSDSAVIVAGTDSIYLNSVSFLKFDLSAITAKSVDSAVLRLFVFAKTGTLPSPLVINRVTSDFDMNTVTNNTMPTYIPTDSAVEVSVEDVLQYIDIDITDLVNTWLCKNLPNYGIALTTSDGTTSIQFGGKPVGASYEPQLIETSHTSKCPIMRMISWLLFIS